VKIFVMGSMLSRLRAEFTVGHLRNFTLTEYAKKPEFHDQFAFGRDEITGHSIDVSSVNIKKNHPVFS
jgi:hypothetical protein